MHLKSSKLPSLYSGKTKTTLDRDRRRIEDVFAQKGRERNTVKDYRSQQEFHQMKASNFLSRINTVDNPQVIFAIADQVSPMASLHDKQNKQTSPENSLSKNSSIRVQTHKASQERKEIINLSKWMDQRLSRLREKKKISFMDVLEYKQTILNYGLGKIIDSVSKKCKQEGQLLSLIWNNTFTMFEGVFNILVDANKAKQAQKVREEKQLFETFETNHNFLRQQNQQLRSQNESIFDKMKKVILWNKSLRKDRKQLNTANRVLEYRNLTYSQSLEHTIEMLLKSSPEPATIKIAKKIISKLAREKNRKHHFSKQEVDQNFNKTTKEFVYSWIRVNTSLNQDLAATDELQNHRGGFFKEDLDDLNEMKQVDIYDFFKLYDIGVQATPEIRSQGCQMTDKFSKDAQTSTKRYTADQACQTKFKYDNRISIEYQQSTQKIETIPVKKQNNNAKPSRYQKHKKTIKDKDVGNKSMKSVKIINTLYNGQQTLNVKDKVQPRMSNRMDYTRHGQVKIDIVGAKEYHDVPNNNVGLIMEGSEDLQSDRVFSQSNLSEFVADENPSRGPPTTKHLVTGQSLNSRIKSMQSIPEFIPEPPSFSSKNIIARYTRNNYKKSSVAHIGETFKSKSLYKLNFGKKFGQTYHQNRRFMEENKEGFVDQLVRRRSFYGRKKIVEFASTAAAEEATFKTKNLYRSKVWGGGRVENRIEQTAMIAGNIEKISRKIAGPSNMTKSKALLTSQGLVGSIIGSIEQIPRIPPNNKVFVSNSLLSIVKYVQSLIPDYIKQIKREKQELTQDCDKVLYPLNILLMEQMNFKYGLKDIAIKKIKNFIEKVLTFAHVSQKVQLYRFLLGLEDPEVGSDELLVYIKCLVYFDSKKVIREGTNSTESTTVDIQAARQHINKILEYFFDHEYMHLLQLKLQIYFQQTAPFSTVEGITLIIVKQLLKRKKEVRQKYEPIYRCCSFGDNFFTNMYSLLQIVNNYHRLASTEAEENYNYKFSKIERESGQSIQALQKIKKRGYKRKRGGSAPLNQCFDVIKIGEMIREMMQRSDIVDEQFGKSITLQRFVTVATISGMPTFGQIEKIISFVSNKIKLLWEPRYGPIKQTNFKDVDRLSKLWHRSSVPKTEEPLKNQWSLTKVYSRKVEEEVMKVMGTLGTIGLCIEGTLFNSTSLL